MWRVGWLTSAVLGTDSQKISILMSPTVVWSVTDMADDYSVVGSSFSPPSPSCCLERALPLVGGSDEARERRSVKVGK